MSRPQVAVALVHHPVRDKRGDTVTTAVTNLDLHDIARTCRTYGIERFYVVTPVSEQQRLVQRLIDHWCRGHGARYNPDRRDALEAIEVVATLDAALGAWDRACGRSSTAVLTAAGSRDGMGFRTCRDLAHRGPLMLVFGTGSGLAPELFDRGWPVLEGIRGNTQYNHLSVRAAAAIIIDRLLASDSRDGDADN